MKSETRDNREILSNSDGAIQDIVNPYEVLQVRRDATPSEIREAYRRLALWHHPGRRKDICDEELKRRSEVFSKLGVCYEVLSDNDSRQTYDLLLHEYLRQKGEGDVLRKLWTPSSTSTDSDDFHGSNCLEFGQCTPILAVENNFQPPFLIKTNSTEDSSEEKKDSVDKIFSNDKYDVFSYDKYDLLTRSRDGKAFSNPYELFEKIFGSKIYERIVVTSPKISSTSSQLGTLSSAWTGTTRLLRDGTLKARTSRVIHDRKLTRTELISKGPEGEKVIHISVTSEELKQNEIPESRPTTVFDFGSNNETMKENMSQWNWILYLCCGRSST